MAYVPSSEVPSAYLISSDADAVLLDLMGTFVLLDGGAQEILFTKHVRQIDANIISAPTKAALTNAAELNKKVVVPLVGNIPPVKSAGSADSVARLLKDIELASEALPITPARFSPKYEPIIISKSLRTGRLEMFVLSGDAKEIETLRVAVESGDEQTIEKAAANSGTISVLVWFPARPSDPIKRILHTGTAPFFRIVSALEKAKSLPFLHSPFVSAANAYKEVGPPSRQANSSKTSFQLRNVPPSSTVNATKAPLPKRTFAPLAAGVPSRTGVPTPPNSTNATSKRFSKPLNDNSASTRTRVNASTTSTTKSAAPTIRIGNASANNKTKTREAPTQKTITTTVKNSPVSRTSPTVNKATGVMDAKISPPKPLEAAKAVLSTPDMEVKTSISKSPVDAKSMPSTPDMEAKSWPSKSPGDAKALLSTSSPDSLLTAKENTASSLQRTSNELDAPVHVLDEVLPEINIDALKDPVSPDKRTPVEFVVIPPTPEPVSHSPQSSVDEHQTGPVQKSTDDKEITDRQSVLGPTDGDRRSESDVFSTNTTPDLTFPTGPNSVEELNDRPAYQRLGNEVGRIESPVLSSGDSSIIPSSDGISHSGTHSKDLSNSESVVMNDKVDKGCSSPKIGSEPSSLPNVSDSLPCADTSRAGRASPYFIPESQDAVLEGDVPEEFKSPHLPQEVGENGLLDDLEDPPRLMKISMDTEDLEKELKREEYKSKGDSEDFTEAVRKLSQQMINDASTALASALASSLVDGGDSPRKDSGSTLEHGLDHTNKGSDSIVEEVKEDTKQMNEKMLAMQKRSGLVEDDNTNHVVKYEETDPIIDSVLETVASDSDRIDLALRNGGSEPGADECNKNARHEVNEDGFRIAADSHHMRLFLVPPSTARGARAPSAPHLSRPLFFELATVPHFNGKCSITDELSAIEYFTNIRSANYILHSEDISPSVLDGWFIGKKHWLHNAQKSRLIPTRHHNALQAFVTANAAQMEEFGLVMNSSLEHNTISLNTEDGQMNFKMIKIEL